MLPQQTKESATSTMSPPWRRGLRDEREMKVRRERKELFLN